MTTLELARKIAVAVEEADREFTRRVVSRKTTDEELDRDLGAKAVFRVLRETDSWFCRMPKDEDGETREETIEPYEQIPLF